MTLGELLMYILVIFGYLWSKGKATVIEEMRK